MNQINDLADVDPEYRCVMKTPKKKYVLRSEHCVTTYYFGMIDGIGAMRSASARKRAGFRTMRFRLPYFGYFFSMP